MAGSTANITTKALFSIAFCFRKRTEWVRRFCFVYQQRRLEKHTGYIQYSHDTLGCMAVSNGWRLHLTPYFISMLYLQSTFGSYFLYSQLYKGILCLAFKLHIFRDMSANLITRLDNGAVSEQLRSKQGLDANPGHGSLTRRRTRSTIGGAGM